MSGPQLTNLTASDFLRALGIFKEYLTNYEQLINDLNVYPVPDSDTGTNSLVTFTAGLANLQDLQSTELPSVAEALATGCAKAALGNSGVILAAYISGFAKKVTQPVTALTWQDAIRSASVIAHESVLHPSQGTMLTIASEVGMVQESDLAEQLIANSVAARLALVKTTDLLPELKLAGVVDSGAVVLTLFHDAFAKLVTPDSFTDLELTNTQCLAKPVYQGPNHELMFSLKLAPVDRETFLAKLETLGESISISQIIQSTDVQQEIRVHIHCDDPDLVVSQAKTIGKVSDLVLINLTLKNL